MSYLRMLPGLFITIVVLGDVIVIFHPFVGFWLLCGALGVGVYRATNLRCSNGTAYISRRRSRASVSRGTGRD